jgi:hypothetical protein
MPIAIKWRNGRNTEADVANESPAGLKLCGVKAETVLLEMCLQSIQ